MNKLVKPVRDFDPAPRKKLEEALETRLADESEVVFTPAEPKGDVPELPEWCNVYAGLSEQEIDELEKAILRRSEFARPVE